MNTNYTDGASEYEANEQALTQSNRKTKFNERDLTIITIDGTVYDVDCEQGCVRGYALDHKHRNEVHAIESSHPLLRAMQRAYDRALDRGY